MISRRSLLQRTIATLAFTALARMPFVGPKVAPITSAAPSKVICWVSSDSPTASDSIGHGRTPGKPFKTLAYALEQSDVPTTTAIYIMDVNVELGFVTNV